MGFKWNSDKETIDFKTSYSPKESEQDPNKCSVFCDNFSTCPKYNEKELKEFQRIKACWDNLNDLKYDKNIGCFYKIEDRMKIFFNLGICPECEDMYISRIGIVCKFKDLTEICKECERKGN